MKLVIDISEEEFDCVFDRYADGEMPDDKSVTDLALYAIASGTEVKHGKWIWIVDESPATPVSPYELNWAGWGCDCCRNQPDDDSDWDDWDNPPKYKYCPNCGADMRGDTDGQ